MKRRTNRRTSRPLGTQAVCMKTHVNVGTFNQIITYGNSTGSYVGGSSGSSFFSPAVLNSQITSNITSAGTTFDAYPFRYYRIKKLTWKYTRQCNIPEMDGTIAWNTSVSGNDQNGYLIPNKLSSTVQFLTNADALAWSRVQPGIKTFNGVRVKNLYHTMKPSFVEVKQVMNSDTTSVQIQTPSRKNYWLDMQDETAMKAAGTQPHFGPMIFLPQINVACQETVDLTSANVTSVLAAVSAWRVTLDAVVEFKGRKTKMFAA